MAQTLSSIYHLLSEQQPEFRSRVELLQGQRLSHQPIQYARALVDQLACDLASPRKYRRCSQFGSVNRLRYTHGFYLLKGLKQLEPVLCQLLINQLFMLWHH